MTVRQKKNIKALAILAILIGAGFAVYQHSEKVHRVSQTVSKSIQKSWKNTEASSEADAQVSEPNHSSSQEEDDDEEKTSALNSSDSESDQTDEDKTKSQTQTEQTQSSEQNGTRPEQESKDQEQESEDQEQESESHEQESENQQTNSSSTDRDSTSKEEQEKKDQSSEEEGFRTIKPSSYSAPVRRRLNRAIRFFQRAEKHYEYAENDRLSLDKRQSENQKARALYKKTIANLDEIRRNKKNHGKKIEAFFKKAKDMYGKCYRRAKMWGAH